MKNSLIGTAGTLATLALENANQLVAFLAGALTAAWMARQLYLSFKPRKK